MLRCTLLIVGFIFYSTVYSQNRITDSLTYRPDTSYNLSAAFLKAQKADKNAAYPEVKTNNLGELIVYREEPENRLERLVYLPKKEKSNKAVVVFIFGGGWRSGTVRMNEQLALALVEKGYTVVLPDYPLSTHEQYPAPVYKLKKDLIFIRSKSKEWEIDSDKIAVGGFSAGGMLASLVATTGTGKYLNDFVTDLKTVAVNALINIDGTMSFVHPESGEGDDSKALSAATMWLGYKKADNYSLWEDASPLKHAGQNSPPTLFINSNINRMHAGRDDYKQLLAQHKIYYEQQTFNIALHHFPFFEPWFTPMVDRMDLFLKKVFRLK